MTMIQSIIGSSVSGDFPAPWPTAINISGQVYEITGSAQPGFWRRDYNYYFADDIDGLLAATPSSSNADNSAQINNPGGQNYSVMWTGYLQAPASGVFRFLTQSDDSSWFWIGSDALSPTSSNANINNSGLHGLMGVEGTPVNLQSGYYYPIRIIYGQDGGGDNFYFSWNQGNTQYNYVNMAYSRYNSSNTTDGF